MNGGCAVGIMAQAYLADVSEDDAIDVCRKNRDEAAARMMSARAEFEEWDAEYSKRLRVWGRKYFEKATLY